MGWVTDWKALEGTLSESVSLDEFSSVLKVMSDWMDLEPDAENVINVLRTVIWSDLAEPVVLGHHGEVIKGLPQLIKAYIEGREYIDVIRLSTPHLH